MRKPISHTYKRLVEHKIDQAFLLMAVQYELVTGNRFQFRHDNEAIFSMVEHALMIDDDKELTRLTLEFVRELPAELKREFAHRGINTNYAVSRFRRRLVSVAAPKESSGYLPEVSSLAADASYKEKADRFWRMMNVNSAM